MIRQQSPNGISVDGVRADQRPSEPKDIDPERRNWSV
jgi:hypothetical protein